MNPARTLACLLMLSLPAMADTPVAMPCETASTGGDVLDLRCPLPATGAARQYRLTAHFSGGHDDTQASIRPLPGGAPPPCSADSKLSLFGEDGDVSLHCRVAAADVPGTPPVLALRLLWSHAQFERYELLPD